jgi:hypothetical protein
MAPKLQPALLGGLFIGVLSALPFLNVLNCCCLWVITGGMLAAYVMQQNHPAPITIGDGAVVGLLAGLFGGIIHYLVSLPLYMYMGSAVPGFSDAMMPGGRQDMPPEVRRFLNELGPQGLLLIASIFFAGFSLLFGMFGGILGALFFKKSPPPPVPPAVPPLPRWEPPTSQQPSWPPPPPPPSDERPPDT